MVSKLDIQNAILKAYGYLVQLTDELATEQGNGCIDCYDASKIECLLWLSEDLQDRVDRNVSDKETDALYEQLLEALSGYNSDVMVDPNASIPYTIINIGGGGGAGVWGMIIGNIEDQLDLMALLATKADIGDGLITPVNINIIGSDAVISAQSGGQITWKIGTEIISVPSPQTLPIADATDNYFRKDWIAMTSNGLIVVQGTESQTAVNPPNLSAGQIGLVVIDVYGDQINSNPPQPPIDISAPSWVVYGNVPFGKYDNGQTVPAAASAFEQYREAYQNINQPNYVAPNATLVATPNTISYEAGTIISSIFLNGTFIQNNAGAITSISFKKDGVEVATTEDYTDNAVNLGNGTTQYSVQFNYGQGAVINNDAGVPDPRGRIEAGNIVRTFTITTFYNMFYGNRTTAPSTSAQVRALPQSNVANNGTYILNTGNTNTVFAIWLPATKTISSVIDLDALNLNITTQYVSNSFSVNDAGGTPVIGNIWIMTQGIPYDTSHRHQFVVANA